MVKKLYIDMVISVYMDITNKIIKIPVHYVTHEYFRKKTHTKTGIFLYKRLVINVCLQIVHLTYCNIVNSVLLERDLFCCYSQEKMLQIS